MARTRTPIVSFGATGKLAGTVVFSSWKGIGVAREYVVPNNPQTPDQTTKRGIFADAVLAYQTYLTAPPVRQAWNLLAASVPPPMSGFNRVMQSMIDIISADPDASYAEDISPTISAINFAMANMDDGSTGDEAGLFDIWVGPNPISLLLLESKPITVGNIITSPLGIAPDVVYAELRKDGQSRSGIGRVQL